MAAESDGGTGVSAPDLTVLIPAYNEADNLRPLLEKLVKDVAPLGLSMEILVLDDGSTCALPVAN